MNVDYAVQCYTCVLTPEGYARLAELESHHTESSRAFVAMWFGNSLESAYEEGITPAVEASGYRSLRIDRQEHIERIDDQIIAEIRRS